MFSGICCTARPRCGDFRRVVTEKARCPAEARGYLAAKVFAAVLVDFDLDDGNGYVLARELRANGLAGRIVAISAHDKGNARLLAAGATASCPRRSSGASKRFSRPEITNAMPRVRRTGRGAFGALCAVILDGPAPRVIGARAHVTPSPRAMRASVARVKSARSHSMPDSRSR